MHKKVTKNCINFFTFITTITTAIHTVMCKKKAE